MPVDWHLDPRFLSPAQERYCAWVESRFPRLREPPPPADATRRWPGSRAANGLVLCWRADGQYIPDITPLMAPGWPPRSRLTAMVCRRPTVAPETEFELESAQDFTHFGDPAEAIETRDGRHLCPHQKFDLTPYPVDAEGIVVCPLHWLRVRVGSQLVP